MDLTKYLIKKNSSAADDFLDSYAYQSLQEALFDTYKDIFDEISENEYKQLSFVILQDYRDNNDDKVEEHIGFNLYYNVPDPSGLVSIGEGYYISPYSYMVKRITTFTSKSPNYSSYHNWEMGGPDDYYDEDENIEYYKLDNRELKFTAEESKKITTKKVYEVKKQDKKYLLVEATDGFYKTTNLKNINKYKKVNEQKVKKFINDPSNAWKGIQVTDLYINPMVIEEFENPDEKLEHAINEFKRKTGIKLEKVYTSNDNIYLHGENKNYSVEITLIHKNGKYEYKSGGTEVIDRDNPPRPKKSMIKTIMTIINNTFNRL